ncbi:hypothetical protein Poly41_05090 [Novipirellula artificiosorum]|uniref:Uncharacterized protein n=1 Tax=Novipirellula artificiosorum TaxID=2528016 RepID=A0A5C6DXP5_9BACT|nr:hypothetical protein Poly41_05090 [Novipirellula artificiosorum]
MRVQFHHKKVSNSVTGGCIDLTNFDGLSKKQSNKAGCASRTMVQALLGMVTEFKNSQPLWPARVGGPNRIVFFQFQRNR